MPWRMKLASIVASIIWIAQLGFAPCAEAEDGALASRLKEGDHGVVIGDSITQWLFMPLKERTSEIERKTLEEKWTAKFNTPNKALI